MRCIITLLLLGMLTSCAKQKDTAFAPNNDCVILRNNIALDYPVEVGIKREATGEIKVEAYRLEYARDSAGKWQFSPRLLSTHTMQEEDYRQIVRLLESPDMKAVAAAYPAPELDGWTWKFRRISREGEVAYSFFCPETRTQVPGIGRVLDLGRRMARAAHLDLHDLSPDLEEEPNKSLDSTTSAGTSAAEQPRVPASVESHL